MAKSGATDAAHRARVSRDFADGAEAPPAPPKRKRRPGPKPKDWRPRFLEAFREWGTVLDACREAGINRSTAYRERQANEDFALEWHDVEEEVTEAMEVEARRRAVEGVERPVYHQGELVGTIRQYSDRLLEFMLKARRPDVYRENVHRVEHSGRIDGKHEVAEIPVDPERTHRVAQLLQDAGALEGEPDA